MTLWCSTRKNGINWIKGSFFYFRCYRHLKDWNKCKRNIIWMSNIVDITFNGFDTWNRTEFDTGPIFGLNMEQYLISRSNFHQTSGRPTLSIFWRSRRFISYKTTQIFKKCARRNIYLNSETLLTFFIGGGKRRRAVWMWVRVRDHCLRLFSSVLCIFLLQVCHLRFGSKIEFIFASGHNGEKQGKLLLYD